MRFMSAVEDAEHDIGNGFSKTYKAEGDYQRTSSDERRPAFCSLAKPFLPC
jgi:hypothetical protein